MKRGIYRILILLCCAGFLFSAMMIGYIKYKEERVAQRLPLVVETIEAILPQRTKGFLEERADTSLANISLEGDDFAGILEVDAYGLKLPVFAKWEEDSGKRPAVYWGNPYDGSLIIGVNYRDQFSFADTMETDAILRFTDLYGAEFAYRLDVIKHGERITLEMLESDADDLTIFLKGRNGYLILRCCLS